jgi:hypothetical protein
VEGATRTLNDVPTHSLNISKGWDEAFEYNVRFGSIERIQHQYYDGRIEKEIH